MPPPPPPARSVEILFVDTGGSLQFDVLEDDLEAPQVILDAIETSGPDDAERILRAGLNGSGEVTRHR
jgi:hypothetical protein